MEKVPAVLSQRKNTCLVDYLGHQLTFSGDFDSGNMANAQLRAETEEVVVSMGRDKDNKPSTKTWFYFCIEGQYEDLTVKLLVDKANVLLSFVGLRQDRQAKVYDLYRPVVRQEGQPWRRLPTPVEMEVVDGDVRMRLKVQLTQSKRTYIALIFPWSVEENDLYLNSLTALFSKSKDLYFNKETLVYSPQKRPLHLLAISSAEVAANRAEEYIENLFPEREKQQHFRYTDKPIILVTSRVHPGEVGASHALNGMLEFLTSSDQVAARLRSEYLFLIVPILNPDGVFNGNNRMDALGQNLNRFYHLPDLQKQPSCYAIKLLVESTRKQIFAFFDLHGHGNKKSCFLYGNSIPLTRLQGESILFAKLLSQNCEEIEFNSCNFSKKHMSSKDRNEDMSKEGCARVVVHRWTSSPYCYTLETGLHKNVKVDDKGIERYGEDFYSIKTYQSIGVKMLTTFHQMLQKNKKIEDLRKEMIVYAGKLEKISSKSKDINSEGEKKKQKKEGVVVTTKQFKFDGQGLIEASKPAVVTTGLPPGLPRPEKEKQNSKKPHSLQSINPDKVRLADETLHTNKKYLMELDNYNNNSDDQD